MGQVKTLHSLQALRGAAALLVVAYHAALCEADRAAGGPLWLGPLRWVGAGGVDLFFVLSGFLIAHTNRGNLGRPAALPGYLFRRLWRIYPTYWVVLGLAVVYYRLLDPRRVTAGFAAPATAVYQFLLLPIPADLAARAQLLSVAWTLSFEVLFYLVFGLTVLLPRRLAGWLVGGWAGLIVAATAAHGRPPADILGLPLLNPLVGEFLCGVAAAAWLRPLSRRWQLLLLLAAGAWTAVGLWLTYDPDPHRLFADVIRRTLVFGPPGGTVLAVLAGRELAGGRPVGGRLLRGAGDASYSIYLLHFLGFGIVNFVTDRYLSVAGLGRQALYLTALAVVGVGAGVGIYFLAERPLLALGKRWVTGRGRPAVRPAHTTRLPAASPPGLRPAAGPCEA